MIDPLGLDSYILYDAFDGNDKKVSLMRKELKKLYGKTVHLQAIENGTQFKEYWNNNIGFDTDGNEVSIDATVLLFHGWSGGIGFHEKNSSVVKWAEDDIRISDLASLDQKNMEILLALTCHISDSGESITQSLYNSHHGIKQIVGADAGVYANVKSSGFLGLNKYVDIYTGNDGTKGFKLYQHDNKADPDYLGGLEYHFKSLTELIKMAQELKP